MKTAIALLIFLFAFSAPSLAADNEDSPGSAFTVSNGGDPARTLEFNFSPAVAGLYLTPGSTTSEQSYTIGTYHNGGVTFFGTASDQTIIWKKERTATSQNFASAGFPGVDESGDPEGSNKPWDAGGWTK